MRARLRKGFTLVEVIIVLVIVGIAAVIAVPGISGYISHTSERACEKMMSSTMDDISRAVTVKKFPSNAAVSIAIYKEINKLPMLRLRCPQSVSDADESEIEKLENGPLTGDTLEVAISPIKSTVEGETYSVGWSFADDYVTVSMECSSHDSISVKQKLRQILVCMRQIFCFASSGTSPPDSVLAQFYNKPFLTANDCTQKSTLGGKGGVCI